MYRYLDRSVATRDVGARFLVWAIREGTATITSRRCIGAALGPAFTRHGAATALPPFAMAMALLLRDQGEQAAVEPCQCARINEYEALLLTMFAATEPAGDRRVAATLDLMIDDPMTAAAAHRAIRTVTAKLLEAGLAPASPDTDA